MVHLQKGKLTSILDKSIWAIADPMLQAISMQVKYTVSCRASPPFWLVPIKHFDNIEAYVVWNSSH